VICEYPAEPKTLALAITRAHLLPDVSGQVHVPHAPGLGMEVDPRGLRSYLVDTEIRVKGKTIYRTPELT
jgi:L-alanine-DL-glutamate epimerase-like enolase superfamily enzyme